MALHFNSLAHTLLFLLKGFAAQASKTLRMPEEVTERMRTFYSSTKKAESPAVSEYKLKTHLFHPLWLTGLHFCQQVPTLPINSS